MFVRARWGVGALALCLSFVLLNCSRFQGMDVKKATKEGILLLNNGTEPADLDPQTMTGVPESQISAALFECLINYDPKDLSPIPGVAESWKISKDQKVYTFNLRKNAKWSNGDAVTAKDFVYSWNRILAPALGSEYAYMLFMIKNAEAYQTGKIKDFSEVGVKALDDYTLQVTLAQPTPYFLAIVQHHSTAPVHQGTIEKFGKMDTRATAWTRPENMVSNGPFNLKEWKINKIVRTVKNPFYWDKDTVKLNEIHFFPVESDQVDERTFRAGKSHIVYTMPLNKIDVYKKENADVLRIAPYLGTYFYRFNTTRKPFNDKRVRRALSLSIDRQAIVEKITKGGQLPAFNFTPPGTAGYTARATLTPNIAEAKKLLAEAGFPEGKGFPKMTIMYNTLEAHKTIAEAIQEMWKKNLGISVELSNQEWKVYLANERQLNYDVSRAGWIGDYVDPTTFIDLFVTKGGNNRTGFSNAQYDAYLKEASLTGDQSKRFEVLQKAEALLMEESPVMPIYFYTRVTAVHPDVKGWYTNIRDEHPYKFVSLSSEPENQRRIGSN